MLKKIVIHIDKSFTNETWRLIFNLFDFCHCRKDSFGRKDFEALNAIGADIRYHDDIGQKDAVWYHYGEPLSYELLCDEIKWGTFFFISIVYKKKDNSTNNPDVSPYISWIMEESNVAINRDISLGIDISEMDKTNKERYIHTLGQKIYPIKSILPVPTASKRCLYYIEQFTDRYGEIKERTSSFPYTKSEKKAPGSKSFLPRLPVNESLYNAFFGNNREIDCPIIDSIRSIEKKLKGIDFRQIESCSPFEEWLIKAYLYHLKTSKGAKLLDSYFKVKYTLHEYYFNIYELVQNIIFHTTKQTGLLSLSFVKKDDMKDDYKMKISHLNEYDNDDRFLVFELSDDGDQGIVERYKMEMSNNGKGLSFKSGMDGLSLKSFFDPKEILPDNSVQLTLRYVAHLGIKTFVSSVICNGGYFYVESNGEKGGKEWLESCGNGISNVQQQRDGIPGTRYTVILPVKREIVQPYAQPKNSGGLNKGHTQQLLNELDFSVKHIALPPCSETQIIASSKEIQENTIKYYGDLIVQKIKENGQLKKCSIDLAMFDEYPPNFIYKLLAYVRLGIRDFLETIVCYNIEEELFEQLKMRADNQVVTLSEKKQDIWSEKYTVVLLSKKLQVLMLCGIKAADYYYVNNQLQGLYTNPLSDKYERSNLDINTKKRLDSFIVHYDLPDIFANYVHRELLGKHVESESGCKVSVPARLGDKIYIDEFFQTDHLFQNSLFAERFAINIAKDASKQLSIETSVQQSEDFSSQLQLFTDSQAEIILIGYQPYSRLLVDYVKRYLKSRGYTVHLIIAIENDQPATENSQFDGLQFEGIDELTSGENSTSSFFVITIVPVATTLSTFEKLINNFKREVIKYNYSNSFIFSYNHCSILVRDFDDKKRGGQTKMEDEWRWRSVTDHTVRTPTMTVHYYISKETNWHRLIDERTFPNNFSEELFIARTHNSSLYVDNLFGIPKMSIPPDSDDGGKIKNYLEFEEKRLVDMKDFIHFGHIEHNNKHFRYYFDVPAYINKVESDIDALTNNGNNTYYDLKKKSPQLLKWVTRYLKEGKKESLRIENSYNIIVTSEPDKTPQLSSFLNKYLFENNALILFLDNQDRNIQHKQSFLHKVRAIKRDTINYFFVDQALLTGNAYYTAKRQMSEMLDDYSFKFDGVITIINRLSDYRYNEISYDLRISKGIFSFNHFFIPSCESEGGRCYLCNLNTFYSDIQNDSVIADCRKLLDGNRTKYNCKKYSAVRSDEQRNKERIFNRMLWQNRLFYRISCLNNEEFRKSNECDKKNSIKSLIENLLTKCSDNIDDKISLLKAIASPPLWDYLTIRQISFELLLKELFCVLHKDNPGIKELFLLKLLLKHLALLGSNALVRRDVLVGSWGTYQRIREQLPIEIQKLIEKKDNESKRLLFEISKDIGCDLEEIYNDYTACVHDKSLFIQKMIERENKKNNKLCQFPEQLLSYVKMAAHNDPSKSLWLGELLRTGNEMIPKFFNGGFRVSKTTIYNKLFREEPLGKANLLLPYLFYENTAITRKILGYFEKENTILNSMFDDAPNQGNYLETRNLDDIKKLFKENRETILSQFKGFVKEKYYYNWFRLYLYDENKKISINQDQSVDGIHLIEKHTLLLYAKQLLKRFNNPSTQRTYGSFDENAKYLLEIFADIMEAQAAYISIKPDRERPIYTLSALRIDLEEVLYDSNYYCTRIFNKEDSVDYRRSFIMRRKLEDKGTRYGESYNGRFNRAAFLTLNHQIKDTKEETIGIVTFLFDDLNHETNIRTSGRQFIKEKQELGKLILLLKPELDEYVEKVAKEKKFDLWVEKEKNRLILEKITFSSGHRFRLSNIGFDKISKNDIGKVYEEYYTMTNMVIRFICSLIIDKSSDLKQLSRFDYTLSNIFDERFITLLSTLNYYKWKNKWNEPIVSIEKDLTIRINKFIFQSFIVQLFSNVDRHSNLEECHPKLILNDSLIIDNIIKEMPSKDAIIKFDDKYSIQTIDKRISAKEIHDYGLTLVSLIKYCEAINYKCIPLYYYEGDIPHFKVTIQFNQ